MDHLKLFEQFVSEGIFLTYNELEPYYFKKFVDSYKELHPNNEVIYDQRNDMTWGIRKGSKEAHWKFDHNLSRLLHSEKNKDVLGLINFKKLIAKNHPWS
jgi:hypothetical protein